MTTSDAAAGAALAAMRADLARIAEQEEALRFPRFDEALAWEIGARLRLAALERGAPVAIDIRIGPRILFHHAMAGTVADNAEWIRRKSNTVLRFARSSYAMGLEMLLRRTTLAEARFLDARDYADHGGGFPLALEGTGCIGAITVSGLPQRDDHMMVVEALAEVLRKDMRGLRLDEGA